MWPAHSAFPSPQGVLVYSSAHSTQYLGNQALGPAYHRPYSVSAQTRPFDSISEASALAKQALLKGLQAGRA